ncbi:UNVERIFIED_CONTAM: hypothetical protein NY603_38955, partial [Bacteroidetes bacterium 56_B9]
MQNDRMFRFRATCAPTANVKQAQMPALEVQLLMTGAVVWQKVVVFPESNCALTSKPGRLSQKMCEDCGCPLPAL